MRRGVLLGVAAIAVLGGAAAFLVSRDGGGLRGALGLGDVAGAHPDVAAAIRRSKAEHPDAWRRRVVLLGFDSCDPDLVDRMIREGKLPNFARVRREGASGPLESTTPPLSPVVWTTVATGMPPDRHGILDFVTVSPEGVAAPVTSEKRQADTIWDLLSRYDDTVGVVGWLVTYPAEPVNGFLVTERMGLLAYEPGRALDVAAPKRTWPEELAGELERSRVTVDDLPLWKVRPFADVTEAEYAAAYSTTFDPRNPLGNLRLTLATAETFRAVGEKLYDERRPRFFALYFEAMDALSHLFMRYSPPKLPEVDEKDYLRYRTAIEQNYVWHDTVLGEFLERADAETTLIVVSDHGFKSGEYRRGDPSDFHAKTGAMWHRPYGVFYAWGNGVARGKQIAGASVFDVAPTVLACMGYPKPEDMRGKVLAEAFERPLPQETVPTYFGETRREAMVEAGAAEEDDAELSPEERAELERLKTLGYFAGGGGAATTRLNLAQVYLASGRVELAIAEFEKALAKARTPTALGQLAEARARKGEADEARKLVDEALAKDPNDIQCRLLLARLLVGSGEDEKGLQLARDLVASRPDLSQPPAVLAMILETLSWKADQAKDGKRAAALRDEALRAQEAALRLEPNQIPSLVDAAQLLLRIDPRQDPTAPARALAHLDRVLTLRPTHAVALNNRSIALTRIGMLEDLAGRRDEAKAKTEEAVSSATRAVDAWRAVSGKEYAKGWANRAYALWKLDRMDEARESALRARESEPSYTFFPLFEEAMEAAGRKLPPPAPPPSDGAKTPPGPERAPAPKRP